MKKYLLMASVLICANLFAEQWKDPRTGITWRYTLLPNSKAAIGNQFYGCAAIDRSFSGDLSIPSTVRDYMVVSIGDSAFAYHYWIKSVDFPSNIMSIPAHAFDSCISLKSVELPSQLIGILDRAFLIAVA